MNQTRRITSERRRQLPIDVLQRNVFALQHLGLAGMVATRQHKQGWDDWDDLMQEASFGVLKGSGRFDHSRGIKPGTYLTSCANGQVMHYRRDRTAAVRIPWRLRDIYAAGQKLQEERWRAGQPELDEQQLADALKISPKRWAEACRCHRLSRTSTMEPMHEALTDSSEGEDEQLTWLDSALQRLEAEEQNLLRLHVQEGISIRRLAKDLGLSTRQLRRRLGELLEQLRIWAQRDGLLVPTTP